MSRQTIFVDFDRTLFNTELFQQLCWQAIGEVYGIDVKAAQADMPHWYHQVGELHYYSLDEQLESLLKDVTPDDVIAAVRPRLAATDFAYPDISAVFTWQKAGHDVHIITFGEDWFQHTKRSFVPELLGLPFHITLEQKGRYIATNFPHAQGVMVDDKRNLDLPAEVREVWLNREGKLDSNQEGGMIIINSLKGVEELL